MTARQWQYNKCQRKEWCKADRELPKSQTTVFGHATALVDIHLHLVVVTRNAYSDGFLTQ